MEEPEETEAPEETPEATEEVTPAATAEATQNPEQTPAPTNAPEQTPVPSAEEAEASATPTAEAEASATPTAEGEATPTPTIAASPTPTAEAEEVEYPAIDFGSFYASDMKITIQAPEGAFAEGTEVTVSEVSASTAMGLVEDAVDENAQIAEVKAVDITFTDKDGNEVQPLVPISVLFSQADLDGNSFAVYHADEGEVEKVADLVSADGGAISADAFSMYVLVGINSVNIGEMATYTMYQGETIKIYADTTDAS